MINSKNNTEIVEKSLKKRHKKELIFKWLGRGAVSFGFLMVALLLLDITIKALPAFSQHSLKIDVEFKEDWLGIKTLDDKSLQTANYRKVLRNSMLQHFPEVKGRKDKRALLQLISSDNEFQIKDLLQSNHHLFNKKMTILLLADDDIDNYLKETDKLGEPKLRVSTKQAQWLLMLDNENRIEKHFNSIFFTNSDSREAELAGIKGALMGTLLTIFVTILISFPIGVAAALYLEEFAPKNWLTDVIEVNINNLAAVPSIVFGLLGLAVIINLFDMPRSTPLVGGIVLSLMTLPTIIIAARASIKAVPPSIREAAIGLGASKMQVTFHHVLPVAMPGVLTGAIIGIAQALGETAPLLMIGMIAFIVDVPNGINDAATVMPVQIFLWADSPERAFLAKTSAAILVLLGFLFTINMSASLLRKKFETKW